IDLIAGSISARSKQGERVIPNFYSEGHGSETHRNQHLKIKGLRINFHARRSLQKSFRNR
ncbi:MAG: hypothetical protein WCA96_11425, partial [Methylocella sp.]